MIPWQIGVALNGADIVSATTTNKTLGEHALSAATDKDCTPQRIQQSTWGAHANTERGYTPRAYSKTPG